VDVGGGQGPAEVAAAMLAGQAKALAAIEPELPAIAAAIDAIADRLAGGGRLVLIGAGNSGRMALVQSSEIGPTFGLEAGIVIGVLAGIGTTTDPRDPIATDDAAEDDVLAGASAIAELAVGPADAVVGISASGRTPYTLAALEAAAECGALTVAVACARDGPLERSATVVIHPAVGPEILAGSTRLAAGSATKTILDILTTGAMIRLGRVHGGRMIDLRVANAKLRERAVRIVVDLTGRTDADAREALGSVDWSPRAAVVRLALGLTPGEARARAAAHRFLADALVSVAAADRGA
jgi:N-acetylmuramic acid 6-phosphate etherase